MHIAFLILDWTHDFRLVASVVSSSKGVQHQTLCLNATGCSVASFIYVQRYVVYHLSKYPCISNHRQWPTCRENFAECLSIQRHTRPWPFLRFHLLDFPNPPGQKLVESSFSKWDPVRLPNLSEDQLRYPWTNWRFQFQNLEETEGWFSRYELVRPSWSWWSIDSTRFVDGLDIWRNIRSFYQQIREKERA